MYVGVRSPPITVSGLHSEYILHQRWGHATQVQVNSSEQHAHLQNLTCLHPLQSHEGKYYAPKLSFNMRTELKLPLKAWNRNSFIHKRVETEGVAGGVWTRLYTQRETTHLSSQQFKTSSQLYRAELFIQLDCRIKVCSLLLYYFKPITLDVEIHSSCLTCFDSKLPHVSAIKT